MTRCPICNEVVQDVQAAGGTCPRCHTLIVVEGAVTDFERGGTLDLFASPRGAQESKLQANDHSPQHRDPPVQTLDTGLHCPPAGEQSTKSTTGNYDETIFREPDLDSFGTSNQRETRPELGSPKPTEVLSPSDKVPTDVNPRESLRLGETVSQIELPIDPPPRRLSTAADDDHAIADYMRLKHVAKGGMGQVSTTRQVSLGRTTAIKELLPQFVSNPQARARFLSEASITAELEHPNIVPVHDLGIDQNGNPFYSMKFVEGEPWDKMIKKQSRQENVETLLKVADAIAYAHSHKIIHRDIKPENVMLGAFGEVLVMDFGLAFRLQSQSQLGSGGTLMYMAPEMAIAYVAEWNLRVQTDPQKLHHYRELMASSKAKINEKSDIYLLGAILYEILYGNAPHYSLEEACQNAPPWPEPHDELARVARRAMETDPANRQTSVLEFQQEIRTYQAHEESTILANAAQAELKEARKSGVFDDFAKAMAAFRESLKLWAGNATAQQGLSDAQISCAMAAYNKGDYNLADSLAQEAFSPDHAFRKKVSKAKRAQKRKDSWLKALRVTSFLLAIGATVAAIGLYRSQDELREANFNLATSKEIAEDKTVDAEQSAARARKSSRVAWKSLIAASDWALRSTVSSVKARISATKAEWASAEAQKQRNIAVSEEEKARKEKASAEHARYVSNVALAKSLINQNDSARAATLLDDLKDDSNRDWEWNRLKFETHPTIRQFRAEGTIKGLSAANHSNRFAVLLDRTTEGMAPGIRLWEVSKVGQQEEQTNIQFPEKFVPNAMALSDDGRWLVVVGVGNSTVPVMWIHDIETKRDRSFTADDLASRGFTKLPANHKIESINLDLPAVVVRDGQLQVVLRCSVRSTFQPIYICGCVFNTERDLVQWQTSTPLLRSVERIRWSADDSSFLTLETAATSVMPRLQLWDWRDMQKPYWQTSIDGERITAAQFTPEMQPQNVVVGTENGRLLLFTPASKREEQLPIEKTARPAEFVDLAALERGVKGIAFSSDGASLLAHGDDRAIHTWNWKELLANAESRSSLQHMLPSNPLRGHEGEVVCMDTLGDDTVVSADALGFLRIGQPQQYRDRWQYRGSDARVTDGDISSDKSVIAAGTDDGSILLWNREHPDLVAGEFMVGHRPATAGMARPGIDDYFVQVLSEQSPRIATCDIASGSLCWWDPGTGRVEHYLDQLHGSIQGITSDGKHVIAGGDGKLVQVVRIADGKRLGWKIDTALNCLAVSPNNLLFVGMKNGTGRLIDSVGNEIADTEMHGGNTIVTSCFAPNGRLLATADYKTLRLWIVENGQIKPAGGPVSLPSEVNRLAFVGDAGAEQLLMSHEVGSSAASVSVVDCRTLEISNAPFGECVSLAVVGGQKIVAALHKNGELTFHRWEGRWSTVGNTIGKRISVTNPGRVRTAGKNQVMTYQVDRAGRLLADLWTLPLGGLQLAQVRLHSASPLRLTRFVDGQATHVVAASADGVVRLWHSAELPGQKIVDQIACPSRSEIKYVAADSVARRLWLGSDDEIFEVDGEGQQLAEPKFVWGSTTEAGHILALAWSANGSSASQEGTLVVLTQNRQVRFFTANRGQAAASSEVLRLPFSATSLAISPDGNFLAAGASSGKQMSSVHVFSKGNAPRNHWKPLGQALELRSRARVSSLTFCESNHRLIIGDDRGRIAIWETDAGLQSRAELFALRDSGWGIVQNRFAAGEQELLTMSQKGEMIVWPIWKVIDSKTPNLWNMHTAAAANFEVEKAPNRDPLRIQGN